MLPNIRAAFAGVAAASTAGVLALAGPAAADPPSDDVFQLFCDNGVNYVVVVNGSGAFTPAHDLASNSILVPSSFGEITFTAYDADGNVVESETEPPSRKGSSGNQTRATTTTCEFGAEFQDGDLTFVIEGTVTGFVTPNR